MDKLYYLTIVSSDDDKVLELRKDSAMGSNELELAGMIWLHHWPDDIVMLVEA